jgi:cytochrome c6
MNKSVLVTFVALSLALGAGTALAAGKSGEVLFKEKCASCHPDGGNIIKPSETLKGIKDPKKIVAKIRKGGGGMTAFDAKALADAEARAIADYVVKTFKK